MGFVWNVIWAGLLMGSGFGFVPPGFLSREERVGVSDVVFCRGDLFPRCIVSPLVAAGKKSAGTSKKNRGV